MSWFFIAALAGLASNLYNILNRYVLKDGEDATAYAWLTELIRLLIAVAFVTFDYSLVQSVNSYLLLALLGFVELVSAFVFMKMHAHSHLSISTIISRTRLIWIPILAYIFLGETLNMHEYIGIAILFLGLSVTVSPHKLTMDKGVQLAYASAFIVAALSIVMKGVSNVASTSVLLIGMSYVTVVLLPFLMKSSKQRMRDIFRKNLWIKVGASMSNVAAMYLYVFALRIGPVSKVTAIYQGMMVVSIVAGIIFLKERQDVWKKLIGTTITLAGVFLLTT